MNSSTAQRRSLTWLAHDGVNVSLDIESIEAFVPKHCGANVEERLARLLGSPRIGRSIVLTAIGNRLPVPDVLSFLLMDWPRVGRLHGSA